MSFPLHTLPEYRVIDPRLTRKEVKALVKQTELDSRDIKTLYRHYVFHSVRLEHDPPGMDDREEFMREMGLEDDPHTCRMFRELDEKGADAVCFVDYAVGVASLVRKGRPVERLQFLFQVYDTDGDGFLSRTELSKMLADHVDMKVLEPDADDAQHAATRLYTWVKRAFKSAHVTEAGLIQCCAVQEMLAPHATLFSALGIDLKLVLHLLCESDKKEVESEEELAAGS